MCASRSSPAACHYLWALTYRWALLSHRNKSRPWVFAHYYFGKFNRSRQDRWVFGDRKTGAYLHRFGWTGIVRHQIVTYRASPDDPDLAEYWGLELSWAPATRGPAVRVVTASVRVRVESAVAGMDSTCHVLRGG